MSTSAERVVAIHQPNFFPWLGWFDKFRQADVFILLDDAQFPKKGGTWINRVKVLSVDGNAQWMTAPIVRSYNGTREIREIELDDAQPWRERITAMLASAYSGAPHFSETMSLLEDLVAYEETRLAEFNVNALNHLLRLLDLSDTQLVRASELNVSATATERLIDLTRCVGGDCYLAGAGAGGYQDDSAFAAAGITLLEQAFVPPSYAQGKVDPVQGLSVIDALMHCGAGATRDMLTGEPPGR